jgi:two-component system response regulator AtoC
MKILLVDDDDDSRGSLGDFLREAGHQVKECQNGEIAFEFFQKEEFELVLSDIKMPKKTGLELVADLSLFKPKRDFDVIIFTGHGDMESAIEALRLGAQDYLLKPINIEELENIIERLSYNRVVRNANREFSEDFATNVKVISKKISKMQDKSEYVLKDLVGIGEVGVFSDKIRDIFIEALKLHNDRDIPVLIQGETGTGKEIIARLIHYGYAESKEPYIDINCAAVSPTLFESELFGYEAGSFTGGLNKGSKGKIDLAWRGTLFLDEIGDMSFDLQAKLLRAIQEKEFYRVGGLKKVKTDVRLICASNVNIEKRVEEGLFRPDLYYRLNVGRIKLPPLRERREEIIPMAQMFLKDFSAKKGKKFANIDEKTAIILTGYYWPGNVRELRNIIEWAVFNFDDTVLKPEHLKIKEQAGCEDTDGERSNKMETDPSKIVLPTDPLDLEKYIDVIVYKALEMHGGNKTKTALYLGISRKSLYCRLERTGYSQV